MQEQSEDIEVESVKDHAGSLYPNNESHYSVNNQMEEDPLSINPFLFEKVMNRQSLIFEHFSLAYPLKVNSDLEDGN